MAVRLERSVGILAGFVEEWPSREAFESKAPPTESTKLIESVNVLFKGKGQFLAPTDPELSLKVWCFWVHRATVQPLVQSARPVHCWDISQLSG